MPSSATKPKLQGKKRCLWGAIAADRDPVTRARTGGRTALVAGQPQRCGALHFMLKHKPQLASVPDESGALQKKD